MCSSFLLHSRAIIEKERYPCAALSALPRFLAIRQVLLRNRASSVRKIYSQIALVQLCGIALNEIHIKGE